MDLAKKEQENHAKAMRVFFENHNGSMCDDMRRFVLELQKENEELKSGFKGACGTCELVGELNQKLQRENDELKDKLKNMGVRV